MLGRKNVIFLLVSAAIFMDMMVYTMVIPVLPSYSTRLGADTMTIGVIYGAFSVALLFCSIPFGMLSDRVGRQKLIALGMLSLAATNAVFVISDSVPLLIFARLLQGVSGAATWSAGLAMLADAYGPDERGQRLGLAMSVTSVGTLLGPAIGGILYDRLGYAATFVLPSALACAVGLLFIAVNEPLPGPAATPLKGRLAPFLETRRTFLSISLAIVAAAAAFGLMEPYMPVYMYDVFSATPTQIGLAFGALSLLSMLSQPLAGKLYDVQGGRVLIAAGFMSSALVIAGSVAMSSLASSAAVFSLLGITMGFALTPMLPLLSDLYGGKGGESLGLVYGIYNTLFSLGLTIAPLAGGLLISGFTFRLTVAGYAALLFAAGIEVYLSVGRPGAIRNTP